MKNHRELIESFSRAKVLVLGDVMLDRYWWGKVERISPEAPVPIVHLEKTFETAGGAANVAANVAGLGACVFLIGLIGDDGEGESLKNVLAEKGVRSELLLKDEERKTTVKTRVIAHNQHVVRVDSEQVMPLSREQEEKVLEMVQEMLGEIDILIASDYAKGFLTEGLMSRLITLSRETNKKVVVDPKGRDFSKYRGATCITPNQKEALEACRKATVGEVGRALLEELDLDCVLITQGEKGMTLFEKNSEKFIPALAREVYDVTGAGDTVIATFATSIACGASYRNAAELANIAAGLVVEEVGTVAIKKEKLIKRVGLSNV